MADATLRPLSGEALAEWRAGVVDRLVGARVAAGEREDDARRAVGRVVDASFPGGVAVVGQHVFGVWSGAERVAVLWIGPGDDATVRYVHELLVVADGDVAAHRRAAVRAAASWARDDGAVAIGAGVVGDDPAWRALYDELGFVVAATRMSKDL
jgi:hypothetical protein